VICDSSSGVQGLAPLVRGWGQSHPEAEALTNLHFFMAILKTDALAGKVHFFKMLSVTLTFETMTLYKRNQFVD